MIFCLGHIDGSRFLNGQTGDQSVGLAQTTDDPFSGTRWHLIGDDDSFTLKCLGAGGGPWFLDGDTVGGLVRLAPHTARRFQERDGRGSICHRARARSAVKETSKAFAFSTVAPSMVRSHSLAVRIPPTQVRAGEY